jgi:hypothetical protein
MSCLLHPDSTVAFPFFFSMDIDSTLAALICRAGTGILKYRFPSFVNTIINNYNDATPQSLSTYNNAIPS